MAARPRSRRTPARTTRPASRWRTCSEARPPGAREGPVLNADAVRPHVAAATLLVALGAALGSTGRYLLDVALAGHGAWPWSTLAVNVSGCLLIGALSRWIARRSPHPLLRPFLVVGVLGGYTTFSAFAVQVVALTDAGRVAVAAGYLVVTLVACLAAVAVGAAAVRSPVPEEGQET